MESIILKLLGQTEYVPSNIPELLQQLHLRPNQQQELQKVVAELESSGLIVRTKGNRYIISRAADLVPGVIQITRGGRGFVQPDEPGVGEIAIAESATFTAMHGDRVLVRRDTKPKGLRTETPEANTGHVVRILERKRTQFVGTLQRGKQFLHVTPDDPRLPSAVVVPQPKDVGRPANIGDKVVVEILQWESRQTPPEGEVIEVLGPPDEEGVDMLSVLRHYALPLHFPKPVLQEAQTIAKSRPDNQPSAEEHAGRVDCRGHDVITIDPDDAKDFDDAICLQRTGEDRWKLWVHIADVSHYVRPGSPLDVEAKKRGNSTYLVDRVIPMLPEALSNELCSLKPDLDRLTKCAEFIISKDGDVISTKFYSAVIRSKRRFTYKEAFAVLQKSPAGEIEQMVHEANAMAQKIRRKRFRAGSLDLDFPENKIRLDDHGKVLRIERIENDISHQLIEEYMLLANEAVATNLMRLNRPAVYRIHESPKDKRLQEYRDDVLSHRIPCGNLTHRPEVQKLLTTLSTLPAGPALKIGFLKSLMRARYAVDPLGHYGLAKTKYTHFTSPIRRYADLVVHRVLFDKVQAPIPVLKQIADHITATERNSSDAERDSKEVKLYAYLKAQIESEKRTPYPALVTDLRNFGFFVDVPTLGLSGVVPLSSIEDDFFIMEPTRNHIVGRHTRRIIKMGDNVTVEIYRVDSFKKQVDFRLVSQGGGDKKGGRPTRKSGKPSRPPLAEFKKTPRSAAKKSADRSRGRRN
ncbi:MAG: ribonuclease R [Prosthecobacter sp.]|nr:ribonuclease R [Prosthecobacter sp.]